MMLCFVQGNGEPSWWVITGNLKLHCTLEFPRELKTKKLPDVLVPSEETDSAFQGRAHHWTLSKKFPR